MHQLYIVDVLNCLYYVLLIIIRYYSLTNWHIVQVDVWGPGNIADDTAFHCQSVRRNPAQVGHVTGSATYASFLSSVVGKANTSCLFPLSKRG